MIVVSTTQCSRLDSESAELLQTAPLNGNTLSLKKCYNTKIISVRKLTVVLIKDSLSNNPKSATRRSWNDNSGIAVTKI